MSKQRKPKRTDAELGQMIGGGRKLLNIMLAIVAAVEALGGSGRDLDRLDGKSESAQLLTQIANLIIGKIAAPIIQVAWHLVLTWIIGACRFVSYVDPNMTAEHFQYQPGDFSIKKVVEVAIKEAMSSEQVIEFLDKMGLRPATLVELLWWWLTNPTRQSNCLVVALGSVWGGFVPYVNGDGAYRSLYLFTLAGGWNADFTFAAVSKSGT